MPLRQQLASSFLKKAKQQEFWWHVSLFGLLGLALWPLTQWFAQSAHEQSRILHALAVLCMASVFLVRFGGVQIEQTFTFNRPTRRALTLAYGLLLVAYLAQFFSGVPGWFALLIIPAYCSGLAAAVRFVFGPGTVRLTQTVGGTLCAFLLLSMFMEVFDWPLRSLAGQWSGWVLNTLGKTVELGLLNQADAPPKLILFVNEFPFHVASECNGFGVILTTLLLALLLAIYRRLNAFDLVLNLAAGLLMGFAFNILRIVIIVLLAPPLMDHYMLMHEIVGGVTYWACLYLAWIFLNGPTKEEGDQS